MNDAQHTPQEYNTAEIAHIEQSIPQLHAQTGLPTILQQLISLALNFLAGIGGSINYKLPVEKFSANFQAFGKTWTFTAEVANGKLEIKLTPQ